MKNLQILSSKVLVIIFYLLITHVVHAGGKPPPLTAAICEAALGVTPTQMDFGSYTDGTGTIAMSITDGTLAHSAGLMPIPSSATVGIRAAFALVQNEPQCKNKDVIFTMPGQINMTNGGSTVTISVLSNDLPAATFKVGNGYTIMMAGTLNATAGDATGTYNGGFNVTFTYVPF